MEGLKGHQTARGVRTVIELGDVSGLPCLLEPGGVPGVQLNLGNGCGLQASVTLTEEQADWLIDQLQRSLHHARTQSSIQSHEDEPA